MKTCQQSCRRRRRGAVTVEFAIFAPVLVTIMVGMVEAGNLIDTQIMMASAAREGARAASMERSGLSPGTTTNEKLARDVKTFLSASGLPTEDVEVYISPIDDKNAVFDLDDPANSQEMFQLRVVMPFSAATGISPPVGDDAQLEAKVVFRNGKLRP